MRSGQCRYRLRTLLIVLAIGPPLVAVGWRKYAAWRAKDEQRRAAEEWVLQPYVGFRGVYRLTSKTKGKDPVLPFNAIEGTRRLRSRHLGMRTAFQTRTGSLSLTGSLVIRNRMVPIPACLTCTSTWSLRPRQLYRASWRAWRTRAYGNRRRSPVLSFGENGVVPRTSPPIADCFSPLREAARWPCRRSKIRRRIPSQIRCWVAWNGTLDTANGLER